MPGSANRVGWNGAAALTAALVLALVLPGCSGGSSVFGGPSAPAASSPAPAPASSSGSVFGGLRDDLSHFFPAASTAADAPQAVVNATPDVECPYIQIRSGASTLIVRVPGDNQAMSLKYQGTFVRAARQCTAIAGQIDLKLGVEGRIILGPAGTPGVVNVPLRIAVVDEKPSGTKTILTKLIEIPVEVRSIDDNPTFTHVEDHLTFPMPSAAELENYIIYIGFDPLAAQAQERHLRARPVRKRKPPRLRPTAGAGY